MKNEAYQAMAVSEVRDESLSWYEATLTSQERKKRGHFSTPPALVEQILDACHYTSDRDVTQLRVLDPACGSGNFLVAAARRLFEQHTHTDLAKESRSALIQRNIWGLDPDPISCFLAEIQLSQLASTTERLHIHQGDALTYPWQEPCVDLFLANPPYLAAKNIDLSAYRSTAQQRQTDSYLLFLQLGLRLVRPNGWLGLVLPDPVLARTNAAAERIRLLQEFTIHHLWHLAGVFAAQVGAVVLIAQKCSPHSTHTVAWTRSRWEETKANSSRAAIHSGETLSSKHESATISQTLLLRQPHAELRYLLSQEQGSTIERLHTYLDKHTSSSYLAPLGAFLSIRRGEEIGQSSPHLIQRSLICRADPCGRPDGGRPDGGRPDTQEWYPVLRGGRDVHPYTIAFSQWWMARQAIVKPLERYLAPKLLVVKSTGRLQAALDLHGHVALQTLYLLQPHSAASTVDDLYFYLALLNSQLLQTYTYVLHTAYKWVQPQIEQHVLARLPIPLIAPDEKQQVIARAKLLMQPCDDPHAVVEWKEYKQHLYAEQEHAIRALYDATLH